MKKLLNFILIIILLNSCNRIETSKHSSFFKIESFIQDEKRIKGFHISNISVDKFQISEYKKFKPYSSELETRKLIASYELTLESKNKDFKAKAKVSSIDSVNWEIINLSIVNQADSISKHFEETITWNYPVSLKPYNVTLKITDN